MCAGLSAPRRSHTGRGCLPQSRRANWPPVGLVFATDPHPLVEKMKDITEWGQYRFKNRDSFGFSVPELAVESHWPLSSGSPAEAEAWVDRLGLVYLVHAEPEGDSPHQISALVRRPPPP